MRPTVPQTADHSRNKNKTQAEGSALRALNAQVIEKSRGIPCYIGNLRSTILTSVNEKLESHRITLSP